jgi:hypothetical protein
MWEARAADGRLAELVAWVDATADREALIFRADDAAPRVVLIDPTGRGLPDAPADLLARPAHQWTFEPVTRSAGSGAGKSRQRDIPAPN